MVVIPNPLASMIAIVPIPEVPPWTSSVSPSRAIPRWKTLCHTVNSVSGSAAASAMVSTSGTGSVWPAGTQQNSA